MYRAPGLLCLRVRKHNVRLIPVAMGTTKHEDTLLTPVKTEICTKTLDYKQRLAVCLFVLLSDVSHYQACCLIKHHRKYL